MSVIALPLQLTTFWIHHLTPLEALYIVGFFYFFFRTMKKQRHFWRSTTRDWQQLERFQFLHFHQVAVEVNVNDIKLFELFCSEASAIIIIMMMMSYNAPNPITWLCNEYLQL